MSYNCVTTNPEFNPELLYNVLHQRQVLTKLRGKPIVADYIDNIELVIGFFSGHLKSGSKFFNNLFLY